MLYIVLVLYSYNFDIHTFVYILICKAKDPMLGII